MQPSERPMQQPWNIAAPSCVLPVGVAENGRFLAGRVREVGLCLFETHACLSLTVAELPSDLAQLPLSWHAHLPVDLPWEAGGAAAAAMALAVLDRVAFLSPRLAVLHAPPHAPERQAEPLEAFARAWARHSGLPLLLENIDTCSLLNLPEDVLQHYDVCLDVAHMLAYHQTELMNRHDLLSKVRLLHWSAPGAGDQHLPLKALTPEQRETARQVARQVPGEALHMVEVFHWAGVEASIPVLETLLEPSHGVAS